MASENNPTSGTSVSPTNRNGDGLEPRLPRDTLALSPNVVLLVASDGTVVQAGGQIRELLQVEPEALEGVKLRDHILPRDHPLVPDPIDLLVGWEQRYSHPLELHIRFGPGPGDEASGGEMAGGFDQEADRWRLFSFSARDLRDDPQVGAVLLSLQPVGRPGAWDVSRSLLLEGIEAANSCIVISDIRQKDQPLVYINEGFRKLTGYADEDVIGQNCRFLQHRPDGTRDEDQPGVAEIRRAIDNGEFVAATLRNYRKGGEMFYNELYLTPVRQDGELVAYIGVQNDVTERIRSEHAVAQREEAIRSFFDAAPMLMGIVELPDHVVDKTSADAWLDARHVMVNGRAAKALRVERGEGEVDSVLRDCCGDNDETPHQFAEAFATAMRENAVQRFSCDIEAADGQGHRRYRVVANVVRPGDGETPRCSYIAEDITEVAAAGKQRELLEAAVESVDDSILITDNQLEEPGPHILYVNKGFTRLTGYEPHEVLGKSPRILQGTQTDRGVLDRLRRLLEKGESYAGETINYRKDGTPYRVSWTIAPIEEDGKIVSWVAAQQDVTRRRQLERQVLDVQQREQQRIGRELHDTVAQSLNTLTLYVGGVRRELERSGAATPEQIEQLREAGEQARLAAEQARTLSHSLTPVSVGESGLDAALTRLCERTQLAYGVPCDFKSDIPLNDVDSSVADQLYRITNEAVGNAMRHGQPTRVTVSIKADGETGTLTIDDDGKGIPGEHLEAGDRSGFGYDSDMGIGMHTMQYRAGLIGGAMHVERGGGPDDRPGTRIRVVFPR